MLKKGFNFFTGKRRTRSSTSDAPSEGSSRRHSVASPRSMQEDLPEPRSDMLLLGGMQDPRSSSMRFSEPRGRGGAPRLPPRRSTRSTAPPPYTPRISEYGFTILSKEEEDRLKSLKGRLKPNSDFDNDALKKLGFYNDIYQLLENLGWILFSDGVQVHVYEEVALEMLMIIKMVTRKIEGEDKHCIEFRLKDEERYVTYEDVGNLLGFKLDAPEKVELEEEDELDKFWSKIAIHDNRQRKNIRNVKLRVFRSWMRKRIFGRMRETKVTDTELNWMYAALVKKQAIDPTYLMIERWCCEATSGTGEIGSGCYLTMIALALNRSIVPNPNFYMKGVEFGIEAMKQGHYIGGDERHGFKIANSNISLPDERFKLFKIGREDWRDEKIIVAAKKNKRGKHNEEITVPSGEEGELPPPSDEYWRKEFQNAPVDKDLREDGDHGDMFKLKHGGMESRHRRRYSSRHHHMVTMVTRRNLHLTIELSRIHLLRNNFFNIHT